MKLNKVCFFTIFLFLQAASLPAIAEISPQEVMKRNYRVSKVKDYHALAEFKIISASGHERVRETETFSKLKAKSFDAMRLVIFNRPADVKGAKTLMIENSNGEDDIWIYLPALKKSRRLISSNKKDSFSGTDFSYGDIIGHRPEDWKHKLVRSETVDGKKCHVVESTPANEQVMESSGYSKRISWIDMQSFVALKAEAYDPAGKLLKKYKSENVKKVDLKLGKFQPMLVTVENVQTGNKTRLEFKEYRANTGVEDSKFTSRSLER
jgi:outer membrane lipoprotein-sorting protein